MVPSKILYILTHYIRNISHISKCDEHKAVCPCACSLKKGLFAPSIPTFSRCQTLTSSMSYMIMFNEENARMKIIMRDEEKFFTNI